MGKDSKISWTHHTFNPWWGCQRVSPGCENCYAEAQAARFGVKWGKGEERRFFGNKHWNEPLKWNKAAEKAGERHRVFVASMADVFEDREDLKSQRSRLWQLISMTPNLDWLLLTKRPENMLKMLPWTNDAVLGASRPAPWPNVWLGTTIEDQKRADERIPLLLAVPAVVRFLSCEPLLEKVDLSAFLCHSPIHEHYQERRGMDLRSSATGGNGDRPDGTNLAYRETRLGSLGKDCADKSMQASPCRKDFTNRVSDGACHDRKEADERAGSSACMASLQRTTATRDDDQSQKRNKGRQQARKSGTCYSLGEHPSCSSNPESGAHCKPERSTKSCSEVDCGPGDRNSSTKSKRRAAVATSAGVQGCVSNNLANSTGNSSQLWVIVGGESGPNARSFKAEWARSIIQECKETGVACFVKQMGARLELAHEAHDPPIHERWKGRGTQALSTTTYRNLKDKKGGDPEEWDEDLRVREFPR